MTILTRERYNELPANVRELVDLVRQVMAKEAARTTGDTYESCLKMITDLHERGLLAMAYDEDDTPCLVPAFQGNAVPDADFDKTYQKLHS